MHLLGCVCHRDHPQPRQSASGRPALQAAGRLVLHGRPSGQARLLVTGACLLMCREQAQTYAAWLRYYRRDAVAVQAQADALLAVASLFRWHKPGASYLLAGGLLYLAGTFLVTIVFNVPRNDALAAVDPASTDGASRWAGYIASWTAWNHVRMAAALAAAVSHTIVLGR